jgi:hypothetical protein
MDRFEAVRRLAGFQGAQQDIRRDPRSLDSHRRWARDAYLKGQPMILAGTVLLATSGSAFARAFLKGGALAIAASAAILLISTGLFVSGVMAIMRSRRHHPWAPPRPAGDANPDRRESKLLAGRPAWARKPAWRA